MPADVVQRVVAFYEYKWARNRGVDAKTLFVTMPSTLQTDLSSEVYECVRWALSTVKSAKCMELLQSSLLDTSTIHPTFLPPHNTDINPLNTFPSFPSRDAILNVPLFHNKSSGFTRTLSTMMSPLMLLESEYIVRKGDPGEEMFFIHAGVVDVVSEDGQTVYASMHAGEFFGEISLIFSCPRTASIRTATKCDLFVLTKHDLDVVLRHFPDIAREIRNEAGERFEIVKKRTASRNTSVNGADNSTSAYTKGDQITETVATRRNGGKPSPSSDTDAFKRNSFQEPPRIDEKSPDQPPLSPRPQDIIAADLGENVPTTPLGKRSFNWCARSLCHLIRRPPLIKPL